MNKSYLRGIFALTIVSVALLFACQKEEADIAAQTSSATAPVSENGAGGELDFRTMTSDEYYGKTLNTAAIGLLELSKDPQFRSVVYGQVDM